MRILITGVYGLVGRAIYDHLAASDRGYEVHGLARRRVASDRVAEGRALSIPDGRFVLSDLSDLEGLVQAFAGMDAVVHMAADPRPDAPWDSVLRSNIIGTYNVFEACRRAGVARVIYASSGQAVLGYRLQEPYRAISEARYQDVPEPIPLIDHTAPTRPVNVYGCSKVWGEGLARAYADSHGMSCIAIRLGWIVAEDRPPYESARDVWASQQDTARLVEHCLNAPEGVRFDIFYGMNDDRYRWVDIARAREVVGWTPRDRAADRLP